jgi:hypothetical protein
LKFLQRASLVSLEDTPRHGRPRSET